MFLQKKSTDTLVFKDLFRSAARYGLLSQDEVERWLKYRDNRNNTAHDYGQKFAQETLSFIKDFIEDVKNLKKVIDNE
ncbi:MAG: nucleotidyltransferase substrate binding protein [Endomicrobium sp.]|nr:nucleotidyltransferase substrate binding protein [Endomicrobium sp.]